MVRIRVYLNRFLKFKGMGDEKLQFRGRKLYELYNFPFTMPKVLLLILDGWGHRSEKRGNAIAAARTPVFNSLWKKYPHTHLQASGKAVGLPKGYMGNSQVGHLTLGAGRIVDSDLVRINRAIKNGSFYHDTALLKAIYHCQQNKRALHLMGLLSDAGVHSHIDHLFALLRLAKMQGLSEVYIHVFLDGRDTPPQSARSYLQRLLRETKRLGVGTIATMMGRYYAMDRDNRWNREHKAYECMVNCVGRTISDPLKALEFAYAHGETDEFVKPTIVTNKCVVEEHDSVIFFNFRSDRARELTRAFVWGKFNQFQRKKIIDLKFVSLTQYDSLMNIPVAFPPVVLHNTLGEVIAQKGLTQLRIAETEKWAHVTYFFNGLCECIFGREKRMHVKSRLVTTYDKTPEMKVKEITNCLLKNKGASDFFVVNFANADMVGHSGNIGKAVKAVEAIDRQIGRIVREFHGVIFITADHGNCENMNSKWQTSHTLNDVPLIVVNAKGKLKKGGLVDVAPTILNVMGIKKPKEMEGRNLFI